jgi:hypothetical protein
VPTEQQRTNAEIGHNDSVHAVTSTPTAHRDLVPIIISFLILSGSGCAFIFLYWMPLSYWVGFVRCIGFVVIMGGVHFVGFRLWKRQLDIRRDATTSQVPSAVWSREVPHGLFWLIILLLLFPLLWALIL